MGAPLRRAGDHLPAGAARPAARAGVARRARPPPEAAVSFLAPLWLAGLLALLLPIALHLLGRGRPPRVELGSVGLLTAGAVRVPRRARLQRPLLLALRCLLLAALAVALAGPRLRASRAAAAEPSAWVFVEPGMASATVAAAIARSRSAGSPRVEVEARWLAP